ncbi:flagellar biosynthetic protein FliO [Sinorhizobium numidicum]|uniref:Flagellar biosynthetic protein FliO n=1 Tax=Sinorhizobium numidicum TaxID=680248 RepID=A0ABY8D079_9HYPH|nr:flagellar biosynthetic protein FliO [Sinorhizobium numidicum]WEX75927.1 flagellar biosynthetic protein FliO [Sinorhizobium numidicum]WEX82586.1 flagellar biosynthetic protein FliO [Sinorhizobium numidicum]
MMEAIVGDNGSRFIIAAGAVAIGLLCLVAVLWIMRNRPSSPFVRGGKNRQPRLAVLDAAAVDTRRRLVLVRRDDVEHLIMIGGPTDIVIESRIAPDEATPATQASARTAPEQKTAGAPVAARSEPKPLAVSTPAPPAPAAIEPMRPTVRPDEQTSSPARMEPAPPARVAADQRSAPIMQPPIIKASQPEPAARPVSAGELSQDVFGAARDRVLPMAQPQREDRPAQVASGPAEPVRPVPTQPNIVQPITADRAAEFDRILDAEISGDLQRLAPTPATRPEGRPAATGRQEPVLGATPENIRKEPTIEEEMNRMLADISVGRKP